MDRQMTTTEILDMLRGQLERDKTYERELEIQKVEARERIEKLEFLLKEREERTEKLRDHIKALESRPTLVQQGQMLEDIKAREEALSGLRASHEEKVNTIEELENSLFLARDERDYYMTRTSAEEILKEEAERKLRFWRGWGVIIGMAIANVLWIVSKAIF